MNINVHFITLDGCKREEIFATPLPMFMHVPFSVSTTTPRGRITQCAYRTYEMDLSNSTEGFVIYKEVYEYGQ